MIQTVSDIQVITATHNVIRKCLHFNTTLTEVVIKLSKLTEQIEAYDGVPNSDKQVADIIRDLCEREAEVKKAIEEELENMSLAVEDKFIDEAFTNTSW